MAVGAVGVIAFAGLQLQSFEISEESRNRTVAAQIANEMYERISSNSQDFSARQIYQGDLGTTWLQAANNLGPFRMTPACVDINNPCTPPQMAIEDILSVKSIAIASLNNGQVRHRRCGAIDPATALPAFDCIVVAWNDEDAANCNVGVDGNGLTDCYVLQIKVW